MKIAHLCLSCFYYDNYTYQENMLPRQNVDDGHDVVIIASQESLDANGKMVFVESGSYLGTDGALVKRVPYKKLISRKLQNKVRAYEDVYEHLEAFQPDIIYFHGLSSYELLTLKRYKYHYPATKIILDCHSDINNTATTFLSRYILHNLFYKPVFKSVLSVVDKIYGASLQAMDFAIDFYGAPKEKVEFYPLGGLCIEDEIYYPARQRTREALEMGNKVMLLQTGKINKKKKAIEALKNFIQVKDDNLAYVIAGNLEDDVKQDMLNLISLDARVHYLGWVNSEKMQDLMCACDVYVQPGSQSASMQQSLCLRCPVILDNVKSHQPFVKDNGWLINHSDDMKQIFEKIANNQVDLRQMSNKSLLVARELLDYRTLANRIYEI